MRAINPATEEPLEDYPELTPSEVDARLRGAADAFAGWRRTPIDERGRLMNLAAAVLRERAGDLARLMSREMGKPFAGAEAEVWLHNGSEAAYADVGLHCGDLRASHGGVLPAASVRFDPSVVDLPARSSRGVVVSVDADVPPGTYRGVVLAAGVPDAWLPIEVVVAAEGREG